MRVADNIISATIHTLDMVSRENQTILGFGLLAIVLLYLVATVTTLPTWISIAVVIVVGVIVPQVINNSRGE
jgi:hypothetical protein